MTVRVNFQAGRHELLSHYADNSRELARVDSVLAPIAGKPDLYDITQAYIRGYASPEAPYDYNLALSQRRAEVFKQYIEKTYAMTAVDNFPVNGMGEDWNGLRALVLQGTMAQKAQVLAIIDKQENFNLKESRLKKLAAGAPYRYMLTQYFPQLRRMEMGVAYTVRALKAEEAEVMIDGRPADLSAAEFFDVARRRNSDATILTGRAHYGRDYDRATTYFPKDTATWINAAAAAIIREDTARAESCLKAVGDNPLGYNNRALYHWSKGETAEARAWLMKALEVEALRETAKHNLEALDKWEQAPQKQDATTP